MTALAIGIALGWLTAAVAAWAWRDCWLVPGEQVERHDSDDEESGW